MTKPSLPTSRVIAMRAGLSHYYTGKPCLNGHLSDRHTTSGQCVECGVAYRKKPGVKAKRKKYLKKYNKELREQYRSARAS